MVLENPSLEKRTEYSWIKDRARGVKDHCSLPTVSNLEGTRNWELCPVPCPILLTFSRQTALLAVP